MEAEGLRPAGSPPPAASPPPAGSRPPRGPQSPALPPGQPANRPPGRRRVRGGDPPPMVAPVEADHRAVPLPTVRPGAARAQARGGAGRLAGEGPAGERPVGEHRAGGAPEGEHRRGRHLRDRRRGDRPARRGPTIGRGRDLPVRRWYARGGGAWPAGGPARFATPWNTGVRTGEARTPCSAGDRPGQPKNSSPSDGRVPTTAGDGARPLRRGETQRPDRSAPPPSCRPTSPRSWPPRPVLTGANCGPG